ncbi:ArsR/SmtB family transcription factor [Hyphobacterium sp.]|uniref:ArsR/SmtB family transcription factor n=1 Tax=Hyphobacterium sp. TaxID=2004662 RepID=UPI003B52B114
MQTDNVFQALGHPVRRAILAKLRSGETNAGALASEHAISRPAVSRHLAVLRHAKLVHERRQGRERIYTLNPAAIDEARAWLNAFWTDRLVNLKRLAETNDE